MVRLTKGPRVLHLGASNEARPSPELMRHYAQAALVDAGFSVLAVDINQAGLAWLAEMGYEAAYMDAESIPREGELFDTIFAGELIEHLSNPGKFLSGALKRLKPGGVLLLSTPQPFSPLWILIYLLHHDQVANFEHTCWYDRQTLGQLLEREGFEIIAERFVQVNGEHWGGRSPLHHLLWRTYRTFLPARLRDTLVVAAQPAIRKETP